MARPGRQLMGYPDIKQSGNWYSVASGLDHHCCLLEAALSRSGSLCGFCFSFIENRLMQEHSRQVAML